MAQTILEKLQAVLPKINDPERLAYFQQFGIQHFADADHLNLLVEGLIEALESTGASGPSLSQIILNFKNSETQAYLYVKEPTVITGISAIGVSTLAFSVNEGTSYTTISLTNFVALEVPVNTWLIFKVTYQPGKARAAVALNT
jgi:hypothetical protein